MQKTDIHKQIFFVCLRTFSIMTGLRYIIFFTIFRFYVMYYYCCELWDVECLERD
jgi:hypothetical protein